MSEILRDKNGRFIKGTKSLREGKRYSKMTIEESLRKNSKYSRQWRLKNKKLFLNQRPIKLRGKIIHYSQEEMKFILSKEKTRTPYENIAYLCNQKFYDGKQIRRGSTVFNAAKRYKNKKISQIEKLNYLEKNLI